MRIPELHHKARSRADDATIRRERHAILTRRSRYLPKPVGRDLRHRRADAQPRQEQAQHEPQHSKDQTLSHCFVHSTPHSDEPRTGNRNEGKNRLHAPLLQNFIIQNSCCEASSDPESFPTRTCRVGLRQLRRPTWCPRSNQAGRAPHAATLSISGGGEGSRTSRCRAHSICKASCRTDTAKRHRRNIAPQPPLLRLINSGLLQHLRRRRGVGEEVKTRASDASKEYPSSSASADTPSSTAAKRKDRERVLWRHLRHDKLGF